MKKIYFISICFFAFANAVYAQTNVDSLKQVLSTSKDVRERVSILSELCWQYRFIDQNKALNYGKLAVELSRSHHLKKELGNSLNDLSIIYIDNGLIDSATVLLDEVIAIRTKLKDWSGVGAAHNKLGIAYQAKNNIEKALFHTIEALSIYENLNDTLYITYCLNNIITFHVNLRNYNEAKKKAHKLLQIRERMNDTLGIAYSRINFGSIHLAFGDTIKAFKDLQEAKTLLKLLGNEKELATVSNNIGILFLIKGEYELARKNLEEALFIRKKFDNLKEYTLTLDALGHLNALTKNYDVSEKQLREVLQIAKENGFENEELDAYKHLGILFKEKGNTDSTFYYNSQYINLKNSIYDRLLQQQIIEIETKYETAQKEEQIKLLNAQQEKDTLIIQKQRWTLISISLFVVLISILAFILFTTYQKKQLLKKEQELQNQKEAERIRIARDMHDDIGAGLTRIVMRSEQVKQQLQLGKELKNGIVESLEKMASESRLLSHNIGEIIWALNPKNDTLDNLFAYIRNYAFDFLEEANITCVIQFPDNIPEAPVSPELRRNIFLIVKESLNNVVKHAEATEVEIALLLSDKNFSITIKDNGKGMDNDRMRSDRNGLTNLEKRTKEIGGKFTIESNLNSGTVVKVERVRVGSEK